MKSAPLSDNLMMRLLLHVDSLLESWAKKKKIRIGAELFDSTDVSRIGNTGSPFRSSTRASFAAHHDVPAVVQGHGLVGRHCTVLVYLEPLFLIFRAPSAYGYRKDLCTHVQPSGNNLLHNALTDKGRI